MNVEAKWLKRAGVLIGAVFVLYIVTPQEKLDHAGEAWLRLTGDAGQGCLDYEKSLLKDPDSARLVSESTKDRETTIKYKAKNSYGAFDESETVCWVDAHGKANEGLTKSIRENLLTDARIRVLELQNECLDKSNQRMNAGLPALENCKK